MKTSFLGLASLALAGVLMAADGGSLTFKSYLSAANNLKFVGWDGAPVQSPDWYCTLTDTDGRQVQGVRIGGDGSLIPVVASFTGATGFVAGGGDWMLRGFDQGGRYTFQFVAYYDPIGAGYGGAFLRMGSSPLSVVLGGDGLVPPVPPGKFDFGGARVAVIFPEPSVLALWVLGLGVWIARRSR